MNLFLKKFLFITHGQGQQCDDGRSGGGGGGREWKVVEVEEGIERIHGDGEKHEKLFYKK